MEALIRKRLRPAEPFPWREGAERMDRMTGAAAGSTVPIDYDCPCPASASASATEEASNTVETKVEALLFHLLGTSTGTTSAGSTRRKLYVEAPGPIARSGTTSTTTTTSAPKLFEAILAQFSDANVSLTSREVVTGIIKNNSSLTIINPADIPPETNLAQFVLAALVFLSRVSVTYNSDDDGPRNELVRKAFPRLPLLVDNTCRLDLTPSQRKYSLSASLPSDWSCGDNTNELRNLERAFLSLSSYPARYVLCPKICSTLEEREVMMTGVYRGGNSGNFPPTRSLGGSISNRSGTKKPIPKETDNKGQLTLAASKISESPLPDVMKGPQNTIGSSTHIGPGKEAAGIGNIKTSSTGVKRKAQETEKGAEMAAATATATASSSLSAEPPGKVLRTSVDV